MRLFPTRRSATADLSNATRHSHAAELRACADVLRDSRQALIPHLTGGTTYALENRFSETPEELYERIGASLALLIEYLDGHEDCGVLYASQKVFELTQLERTREENYAQYRRTTDEEEAVYVRFLRARVSAQAQESFVTAFRTICAGLLTAPPRHIRALFIGDCLMREILGFAMAPLMQAGVSIDPFPINPRDCTQLAQILSKLSNQSFDVVFFSPFSHTRLAEITELLVPRAALRGDQYTEDLVKSAIAQTRELLTELASRFECPIFVHNAGLLVRGGNAVKIWSRALLAWRSRSVASKRLNRWLEEWIETTHGLTFPHLFVIDEERLVRKHGHARLGRFLSTSKYEHSVLLSRHLAREYCARVGAVDRLLGKKLVICDLDNTLWEGLIGEGEVVHYHDRQKSLKRLKEKSGVVLSIASKNDPANVHFDGCHLVEADFVVPQISWGHKSNAIATIRKTLNLQTKHMVFLDDRADERALVGEAYPDMVVLDPNDPATWELIDLWGDMSQGASEVDRTALYQVQGVRDAFLSEDPRDREANDGAALKKLGLVASISSAQRADLKRIAELVNRTNQWNLCGSRTTFAQVRAWHNERSTEILVGKLADRFGDMGMVCVAIVFKRARDAAIGVFVLSCRAFGYGIESAMLAEISRRCDIGESRQALIGLHRPNAQNHPCHDMYPDHGFEVTDGGYEWKGAPAFRAVPWLEVLAADGA